MALGPTGGARIGFRTDRGTAAPRVPVGGARIGFRTELAPGYAGYLETGGHPPAPGSQGVANFTAPRWNDNGVSGGASFRWNDHGVTGLGPGGPPVLWNDDGVTGRGPGGPPQGNQGSGGVAPTPPGGKGGGGGGKKGGKPPSPFDAEYYANIANYLFKTNNAIGQAQLGIGNDRTVLASALGQLSYAQPRASLALEERANQAGGLYSSALGQQEGDLNNQYATKEGGLSSAYGGRMAALARQVAGLRGSIPLYKAEQAYLSAQRLAAAAAKNPALGQKTGPLVPTYNVQHGGGQSRDPGARGQQGRNQRGQNNQRRGGR